MEVAPRTVDSHSGDCRRGQVKLHYQEPLHHCRPAVDYLFSSAARMYGPGALALVLTGMGADGLDGARAVHSRGGVVLAQDEATSAVWGMPGRVAESGIACAVLPLDAMARQVNQRARTSRTLKREASLRAAFSDSVQEVAHGLH